MDFNLSISWDAENYWRKWFGVEINSLDFGHVNIGMFIAHSSKDVRKAVCTMTLEIQVVSMYIFSSGTR